jgi:bromodomain adjacent to zinc finger domain protein 1A
VPFQRHSAIRSMLYVETSRPVFGVPFQHLSNALSDVGNNWERVPLRSNEGREGWEDALVGCLKDVRCLEFSF